MAFPLEKILTVGARDWFKITRALPTAYDLVGVHASASQALGVQDEFLRKVPEKAEVVVDYKLFVFKNRIYASGTALVKKE